MLLHLDAPAEAGVVIATEDGHGRLHEDAARIHLLADQVGRAARQGDSRRQGLAHRIEAAKARQQGGVNVDQPVGEGANKDWGDNPHPARHHHQIHRGCPKGLHQSLIELLTVWLEPVVVQLPGNAQPFGPPLGTAIAIIHN